MSSTTVRGRADHAPTPDVPVPPAAARSRRPGWRNPRLVLGLLLVAASVVAGARVVGAADDSVPVWALARDLPAGATVADGDLEQRRVRFPDAASAAGYLSGEQPVPAGTVLNRPVAAGDLLPRAAVAPEAGSDLLEVPISVVSDDLPATVEQGSVVDVWVTPQVAAVEDASRVRAERVLADVTVVAVPGVADTLAPQTTRQVIVGVPSDRAADLPAALGGISEGRVVIARKG
ncbi:hypothetical protein SAMN04488570_1502 [Nocardioides scoriae]|uniref:SAF domain-containing protein n=1 Tax=Nocardioides scoriae TaxID=642780 RepID=A0A1H1QU80_9ACTN|nr:hypothetical protein [Nocardioides scoriae]SDS26873.1 hypothetical protein SAMN04488570_1502 [Nocardioides scoriae]